jgi:hypothetical protein
MTSGEQDYPSFGHEGKVEVELSAITKQNYGEKKFYKIVPRK